MKIHLCCGNKKREGYLGVDWAPIPGVVDQVHDLNQLPWPFTDSSASEIFCEHGFEHIQSPAGFMSEVHRILKPGGQVTIITPHFSSVNSYSDPTHLRHLSSHWWKVFSREGYLKPRDGSFELIEVDVTFGKSLRAKIGRFLVKLRGLAKWEKNAAFRYPALDLIMTLRTVK